MTFAEALSFLSKFHIIRRPRWEPHEDIYLTSWGDVIFDVTLTKNDIDANDWEVTE